MNRLPILIFIGVLLAGSLYVARLKLTQKVAVLPSSTASTPLAMSPDLLPTSIPTTNPVPSSWNVYSDRGYGLTFRYPPIFTGVNTSSKTPSDYIVPATAVTLKSNNEQVAIIISNLRTYTTTIAAPAALELQKVYDAKAVSSSLIPTLLPPSQVTAITASDPVYIQSANGIWRGIRFYAYIGEGTRAHLTSAVIIVTNGQIVWQLVSQSENTSEEALIPQDHCLSNSTPAQCAISPSLQTNMEVYLQIANTLT